MSYRLKLLGGWFLFLVLLVLAGDLAGQRAAASWGVGMQYLVDGAVVRSGQRGDGQRLTTWGLFPISERVALWGQLGYRQITSPGLEDFKEIETTWPTYRFVGWEKARIEDIRYYDASIGAVYHVRTGRHPERWSLRGEIRYSRLAAAKGKRTTAGLIQTIIVVEPDLVAVRQNSAPQDSPVATDFKTEVHPQDIGFAAGVSYLLLKGARLHLGYEFGLVPFVDPARSEIESDRRYRSLRIGLDITIL